MHIDDILTFMGGIDRAYAIAEATRADAEQKLANGARAPKSGTTRTRS